MERAAVTGHVTLAVGSAVDGVGGEMDGGEDIGLGAEDGEAMLRHEKLREGGESISVEVAVGVVVEEELHGHLVHAAGNSADEGGSVLLLLVTEVGVCNLRLLLVVALEGCHVS